MARTVKVIRKKAIKSKEDPVANQKIVWTAGHAASIVFGALFAIIYVFQTVLFFKYKSWKWLFLRSNKSYSFIKGTRWYHSILRYTPNLFYKLSLTGFISASTITFLQNWKGLNPSWYDLLSSENFQSLLLAAIWFLAGRLSLYTLVPFVTISYMHLRNKNTELDTETKDNDLNKATLENAQILEVIAYSEIAVALALLLDTLLLKDGTSGFSLVIYLTFYWLRLNFSSYTQVTILRIWSKADQYIPGKYKDKWSLGKDFIYTRMKIRDQRKRDLRKLAIN